MANLRTIAAVLALAAAFDAAAAHGRMTVPLARNAINSVGSENGAVGGGPASVHQGGRYLHGICGNAPGTTQDYNKVGAVQATFEAGRTAEFKLIITAHHMGFFEFELCADAGQLSEECFAQHRLLKEGCECSCPGGANSCAACDQCRRWWKPLMSSEAGSWVARDYAGPVLEGQYLDEVEFTLRYTIPAGVRTGNGVIRWHYMTTNSCTSTSSSPEEFWNCADVAITDGGDAGGAVTFDNGALASMVPQDLRPAIRSGQLAGVYSTCPLDGAGKLLGVGAPNDYFDTCSSSSVRVVNQYCSTAVPPAGPAPLPLAPTESPTGAPTQSPTPVPALTPAPSEPKPEPESEPEPEPEPEGGKKQLVAFVENWKPCPSVEKIRGYDKAIVSFAVSYTWSPDKNRCDQSCAVSAPATCDNRARPDLIQAWRQAGTKVLLSFGGAGMGGSWAGDRNDCWEHCFGRVDSVVSQLASIVGSQGFDGVDIDYEYFHSDQSDRFLKGLTTGLRSALPAGKIISHAPMDGDVVPGKRYFNVLKEVASSVDYLLPQYYNGPTRPASDLAGAVAHMGHLVNGIFSGDASKVVFGFCIADCAATGSNVDGAQAASVLRGVARAFPEYGGAFLWAASDDNGWSDSVKRLLASAAATPTTAPTPTMIPTTAPTTAPTMAPTTAPTKEPTMAPTMAPTVAPTTAPTMLPTMQPTSAPTASPTPTEPGLRPAKCAEDVSHHGSHAVGPCSKCLAANGVCYGGGDYDSESYCTQWPANTWCGGPALAEARQAKVRQHAFRGTALVQTMSPLSRTVLGDEL